MKKLIFIGFVFALCGCGSQTAQLRTENRALREQVDRMWAYSQQREYDIGNLQNQIGTLSSRDQSCTVENAKLHGAVMRLITAIGQMQQQPPKVPETQDTPPQNVLPSRPRGLDL